MTVIEKDHFLDPIKGRHKGSLKVYIGMIAGVGKTYRMLQEAHDLLGQGVDVKIGFIEAHERKETIALISGIPNIPVRTTFYKGKEISEMDLEAIMVSQPGLILVDELALTNIPGRLNEKRWQDVSTNYQSAKHIIRISAPVADYYQAG